jgi:sirohydrochlorin cobaltochelatase
MPDTATHGTILLAHGSRDPYWQGPVEAVARRIRVADPAAVVRCAYLEFTAPDLRTSAAELLAMGVSSITVVPLLLGMGKHAGADLARLMAELQASHPGIEFTLRPAIGQEPRMIELMARIAQS